MRRSISEKRLAAVLTLCAVALAGCGKPPPPAPKPNAAPTAPHSESLPVQGENFAEAEAPLHAAQGNESSNESSDPYLVILTGFGDSKIQVIKVVREATGMGLKEAKDFVEGPPETLKSGLSKADAEKLKRTIEAAGGTANIEPASVPIP